MKKYKAIFFDFDGVIGETMEDNYEAWRHAFSKYRISIDKDEYFLLEGMNTKGVAEYFFDRDASDSQTITEIVNRKEKYYLENNRFRFYDGVEKLIPEFKRMGYFTGLVSGASNSRLLKVVNHNFLKHMDVIITGDKVYNCKPHPEPYLNAAKALSISPSECVVIENAPVGIESAKSAGMYCIAICSTLERRYLEKADMIINKFADLEKLL